ncbi:MAG: amidohydrolase family protein, partial [Leptolyngbya sp. SIO1D8]|nr:amidohydrolase family protein [Leptolyngbya sp. SIO1D8]
MTAATMPARQRLDANGNLVVPGFVDAHIHLDKAFLLAKSPAQTGDFSEALATTLQLKKQYTIEDIQVRARTVLERAIAFGITAMRSHVEVDPILGITSMEALLPLKQDYAWGLTLQLAVFAQEGITNQPGTEALLRKAMAMGGNVIGSAPYVDPDPRRNIEIVFDIAQEFDCDVDFHLDFLDDDAPLQVPMVVEETHKRNWQGRVCLGHMTKLAGLSPKVLAAIAADLQSAAIAVLALPASDLYMMSRKDTHNVRRGVAPLNRLQELGVTVGTATNNIQNLFTPFGDGDVLKIGTLLANVLQLGTTASHEFCLDAVTQNAARAIGITNYGIAPGCVADLVIL